MGRGLPLSRGAGRRMPVMQARARMAARAAPAMPDLVALRSTRPAAGVADLIAQRGVLPAGDVADLVAQRTLRRMPTRPDLAPPAAIAVAVPMLPRAPRASRINLAVLASTVAHAAFFVGMVFIALGDTAPTEPPGVEMVFEAEPAEAGETFSEPESADLPSLEPAPEQPPVAFEEPPPPDLPPLEEPPPEEPPPEEPPPEEPPPEEPPPEEPPPEVEPPPEPPPLEPPPEEPPPEVEPPPPEPPPVEEAELPTPPPEEEPPPPPDLPPPPPVPPPPPQPRQQVQPPRPRPQPQPPAPRQAPAQQQTPASTPGPAAAAAAPRGATTDEPPVLTAADYARAPTPPRYPPRMLQRRIEGTVVIRALVDPQGVTRTVRVHRSSGFPELDVAAETAARGWVFRPARRGGVTILHWVEIPVRFRIR